jgi:hypothetical protein
MAIDSPTDKIRLITEDTADSVLTVIAQSAGAFAPIVALAGVVQSVLDFADYKHRVFTCIRAICDEFDSMRGALPADAESAIKQPWFATAVRTLISEIAIEADDAKVLTLARATARGCFPDELNLGRRENLATYIRQLAQLGADDICILRLLQETHSATVRQVPSPSDPAFVRVTKDCFLRGLAELQISQDDALALCSRLVGFGLAREIPNPILQTKEHFYQPTMRGAFVFDLLREQRREKEQ